MKGFAQNRLFLGVRLNFSPEWAVEPGYLNVRQCNAGAVENDMFHVPTLYFFYKANLIEPELSIAK